MNVNDVSPVRFRVSSQHMLPITVTATDWMSALGAALNRAGRIAGIRRMACEQVGNGDFIVNDLTNRHRYVVQALPALIPEDYEEEVTEIHYKQGRLSL
jgi:hypothetical protein